MLCWSSAGVSGTRTIIDYAGDTVEVPETVKTVIKLIAYDCQTMAALNFGDYLIGINDDNKNESPEENYSSPPHIYSLCQNGSVSLTQIVHACIMYAKE